MEYVTLGQVVNVRGLKGELKILSLTNFSAQRYKKGKTILLHNETNDHQIKVVVKSFFKTGNLDYVQFEEITDVEPAKTYIGYYLKIPVSELKNLGPNSFYYHQLLGCSVFVGNKLIGMVNKIDDIGAQQLLRIKPHVDGKDILVPFVEHFLEKVDINNKKIIIRNVEGLL
jgi:16S rRNA processing protein RimM